VELINGRHFKHLKARMAPLITWPWRLAYAILAVGLAGEATLAHGEAVWDARVEVLGRPLDLRYQSADLLYARNIWDLRWYKDRLYAGGGNSSNKGPAANAGPVPLFAFDIASNQWVQEGHVDDEQIDHFTLLDGALVTPGHDPRQSWEWGNFYVRSAEGKWTKHRNIPAGVHTYDMVSYNGLWFAALGTAKGGAIAMSENRGASWETVLVTPTRVARFMVVNGQLLAMPVWGLRSGPSNDKPVQWRDGFWVPVAQQGTQRWFPATNLEPRASLKIQEVVSVDSGALYIGAYTHNDHQARPFGLYFGSMNLQGNWSAEAVPLPNGWEPWDLVETGQAIYLLLNRRGDERSEVQIWRSQRDAPKRWVPQLTLTVPGFARALEVRDGVFYLGIGSEDQAQNGRHVPVLHPETGLVLRVRPDTASHSGSLSQKQ
jgi:hypothetical protein